MYTIIYLIWTFPFEGYWGLGALKFPLQAYKHLLDTKSNIRSGV